MHPNHEVLADGSSWPSSAHGRFTREEITMVLTRYVAGRAGLDDAERRTNLLLMLSGIELWFPGRTARSSVTTLTELCGSWRSFVNTGSSIKFRTPRITETVYLVGCTILAMDLKALRFHFSIHSTSWIRHEQHRQSIKLSLNWTDKS